MTRRSVLLACLVLSVSWACLPSAGAARAERWSLRQVTLDLPGPPSTIVPADLDGDGAQDLLVVVAYTEVQTIGIDRIEEMVQITTVVPALFDRREAHAFRRLPDGSYGSFGPALDLPVSVLSVEAGPPGLPVVALTDRGVSELRLRGAGETTGLELVPLIDDPPLMAGTETFFASLRTVHDVDGDGRPDLLLPTRSGPAVYLGTGQGLAAEPADRPVLPGRIRDDSERSDDDTVEHFFPYPEVRELNGDGKPDLLLWGSSRRAGRVRVLLGAGGGRFRNLRERPADCWDDGTQLRFGGEIGEKELPWPSDVTALRDLDGDGRAEVVTRTGRDRGDSMRKEMKDAKRPIGTYRFHRTGKELAIEREPYFEAEVEGHNFEDAPAGFSIAQFDDLDGDGREDLVTITLEFSFWQAVRILTTKKISIGIDFHVWAQRRDGSFRQVEGLDLSEKLKFDLNNLTLGRFAQFAGDFDGDGRKDFVHLGRGKKISVHRGQPGCRYPEEPDLVIELDEPPESLELIRILDLDGDGRSDIMITRPLSSEDPDATAPVRLDLYLGGAER